MEEVEERRALLLLDLCDEAPTGHREEQTPNLMFVHVRSKKGGEDE